MAKPAPKPKSAPAATRKPPRAPAAKPAPALPTAIRFTATLHRPAAEESAPGPNNWLFLRLPKSASDQLPSRSMVSVEGTINGGPLLTTLIPDGEGGHWLKVDQRIRRTAGEAAHLEPGESVSLEITPLPPDREPEPEVPADLRKALAEAPARAREVWAGTTPIARRDWIHWITSGKLAETRTKRIATACDMLANGKKRPCCFDRSGMYSNSLSCPMPELDDDR